VRVLVAWCRHIQPFIVLDGVVMVVMFDKLHVIVVAVVLMAQAQAGDKLMRLGYLLLRFHKAVALHERERLTATV